MNFVQRGLGTFSRLGQGLSVNSITSLSPSTRPSNFHWRVGSAVVLIQQVPESQKPFGSERKSVNCALTWLGAPRILMSIVTQLCVTESISISMWFHIPRNRRSPGMTGFARQAWASCQANIFEEVIRSRKVLILPFGRGPGFPRSLTLGQNLVTNNSIRIIICQ